MLKEKFLIAGLIAAIIIIAASYYPIARTMRSTNEDLWFSCTVLNCSVHQNCYYHCYDYAALTVNLSAQIRASSEEACLYPDSCCAYYLNKTLPCLINPDATVSVYDSQFHSYRLANFMISLLILISLLELFLLTLLVSSITELRKKASEYIPLN